MSTQDTKELAGLVEQTIKRLYDKGIPAIDLAPLVKLHDAVKNMDLPQQSYVNGDLQAGSFEEQIATASGKSSAATHGPSWGANAEPGGIYDRDGRRGEVKASEDLMARASAIVDLLVQSGDTTEHACQVITRQLLSVGIQLPESGGDARAWKRLMNWRNTLIHYKRAGTAWDVYCAFKEKLAGIPAEKRIRMAVGERLWDQRKLEFSAQSIA